jgi:hypothetical protein
MKTNVGSVDKIVRIVLAALFAILYFTHVVEGTLGIILLVVAGVFLVTSLIGFCPIWAILGTNTSRKK